MIYEGFNSDSYLKRLLLNGVYSKHIQPKVGKPANDFIIEEVICNNFRGNSNLKLVVSDYNVIFVMKQPKKKITKNIWDVETVRRILEMDVKSNSEKRFLPEFYDHLYDDDILIEEFIGSSFEEMGNNNLESMVNELTDYKKNLIKMKFTSQLAEFHVNYLKYIKKNCLMNKSNPELGKYTLLDKDGKPWKIKNYNGVSYIDKFVKDINSIFGYFMSYLKCPLFENRSLLADYCSNLRKINYDSKTKLFDSLTFPKFFIHYDLHPKNIILTDKSVRFVDMKNARMGNPICDLSMVTKFTKWDDKDKFDLASNYREAMLDLGVSRSDVPKPSDIMDLVYLASVSKNLTYLRKNCEFNQELSKTKSFNKGDTIFPPSYRKMLDEVIEAFEYLTTRSTIGLSQSPIKNFPRGKCKENWELLKPKFNLIKDYLKNYVGVYDGGEKE